MPKRIIDLSFQLEPGTPVFPDYEPFQVSVLETTEDPPSKGRRSLNSSRIALGLDCGTHMDAPLHFIPGARTIEEMPLEQCAGPALLIRLPERARGGLIEPSALEPHSERLRQVRKVVLDTGWCKKWEQAGYFSEHPLIWEAAARFIVAAEFT